MFFPHLISVYNKGDLVHFYGHAWFTTLHFIHCRKRLLHKAFFYGLLVRRIFGCVPVISSSREGRQSAIFCYLLIHTQLVPKYRALGRVN